MTVDLSFYKSPLSEEIRDEGRAEGLAEGLAEGRAISLLLVLEVRGIDVPDEAREKINGCGDPELLLQWLHRAVTATSAEGVFASE